MSDVSTPYRFRVRRRTAASWTSLNEVLLDSEIGLESDTVWPNGGGRKFKVGPGAWNSLDYAVGDIPAAAANLAYDNTTSGLTATDVQAAVDEVSQAANISIADAGGYFTGTDVEAALQELGAGGGGGGGMALVGTVQVSGSPATSLTLSGLDLAADGSYVVHAVLKNAISAIVSAYMFYNGDTIVSNYWRQALSVVGGALAGEKGNDAFAITMEASAQQFSEIVIRRDVDGNPRANVMNTRGTITDPKIQIFNHARNNTANVTSITLTAATAGAFAVGSYFKVFKVG